MRVTVSQDKLERVWRLARRMAALARRNRRLVPMGVVRSFCGVCVSLSLALPLARFYTRSLYWDMAERERALRSSREDQGQSPQRSEPKASGAEDCSALSHWRGGGGARLR